MHSNADTLLAQHPDIETVEALITDCNGAARGKWLPIEKLRKWFDATLANFANKKTKMKKTERVIRIVPPR